MTKLKPCPFCGNNVELEFEMIDYPVTNFDNRYKIFCNKCKFGFFESIPGLPKFYPDESKKAINRLIRKWNKRTVSE